MRGAVLVAISATIGNFLQGWDNATIAGPEKELLQLAVYGELRALFPGVQVHIVLVGHNKGMVRGSIFAGSPTAPRQTALVNLRVGMPGADKGDEHSRNFFRLL